LQVLMETPDVTRVVGLDVIPPDPTSAICADIRADSRFQNFVADLSKTDLVPLIGNCDVLVHLASESSRAPHRGQGEPDLHRDAELTQVVLAAAARADITHLVVMSSAVVYGAWPDNPVPMTEAHEPKPNPGFAFAASRLEVEELAHQWRNARPGRTVTILRPAVSPSASGTGGWLAQVVYPSRVDQLLSTLPPLQFVHVDDVASAVVHSVQQRLDGTFNVAPDRWLRGEDAPPLMGVPFSVPATGAVWEVVSTVVRTIVRPLLAISPRPEGAVPLSRYPWVVANDRLRATGWQPLSTTEEVLVARRQPSKMAKLFARKRQEVTIAAVGTAGASVAGAAWLAWKRWFRRR
jgi:nucleoside-diphosphate-sugar epimerase